MAGDGEGGGHVSGTSPAAASHGSVNANDDGNYIPNNKTGRRLTFQVS